MTTPVVVTPLSDQPDAIAATVRTLEALPMAGFVHTETRDGLIFGTATSAGFLAFACEKQGYAKAVEEILDVPSDQRSDVSWAYALGYAEPRANSYEPLRAEDLYASAHATVEGRALHRVTLIRIANQEPKP